MADDLSLLPSDFPIEKFFMAIKHNGRLYMKQGNRWFIDSRKRWRPIYDKARLEIIQQLEKELNNAK